MSTKRNNIETLGDSKLQFNAQLSGFNSLATRSSLTDSISALMLLTNAVADSSQPVSTLAAAAPSATLVNRNDSTDKMLQVAKNESVATVLRKCENHRANYFKVRTIGSSSALVPPASVSDYGKLEADDSTKCHVIR